MGTWDERPLQNCGARTRTFGLFACAMVATLAVSGAEAATNSEETTSQSAAVSLAQLEGIPAEELADLRQFAADSGTPLDEVLKKYGGQGEFVRGVTDFATRFPDAFAGSAIGDGGVHSLFLTQRADAQARDAAATVADATGARVVADRVLSHEESVQVMEHIGSVLRARLGTKFLGSAYRESTGRIEVSVANGAADEARGGIDELRLSPEVRGLVVLFAQAQGR
ncbi:hypothetical protein ACOCJ7_11675 [Knoellia sp. CPCC 206453]|uniref:hypothetical protein n=1 Tax=Knoellia pratensis TaxID=3404796 RepID=UPI0036164E43